MARTNRDNAPAHVAAPKQTLTEMLAQRGTQYGNFLSHAVVTQAIKTACSNHANQQGVTLDADMCEAIDMIAHKLGRIVNGNPRHVDSWTDIAGYAQLVADRLEEHN